MTETSELKAAYEAAQRHFERWLRDNSAAASWQNYAAMQAKVLDAGAEYIAALEADNARLTALVGKLEPYAILHAVRAGDFTLIANDLELAPDADASSDTDDAHVQP